MMPFKAYLICIVVVVALVGIGMLFAVIFLPEILANSKVNKRIRQLNREINTLINSL
jgi:type II secretory pathway pseudopilin PulG